MGSMKQAAMFSAPCKATRRCRSSASSAPVRAFPLDEEILLQVRVPHVHDARQARAEFAPVVDDAREGDAAEIHAVVGALARDEHVAPALAARLVVGESDLHRRVDRLRAGIDEKDPVEVAWRELGHARGEFETLRMRAQERRDEVELDELPRHGLGDLPATMTGIDAKHARRGIDELAAAVVPIKHPLRAHDHFRIGLEIAVGGEGHPVLVERDLARLRRVVTRDFGMVHHVLQVRRGQLKDQAPSCFLALIRALG